MIRDLQTCIDNESTMSKTSKDALLRIINSNKLQFDTEFMKILEEIIIEHAMDQGRTFQLNFTEAFNLYMKQQGAPHGNNNVSLVADSKYGS